MEGEKGRGILNSMRYEQTGEVVEGFHVIGNATVPVYLLDGQVPVLFDAGMTALGPAYEGDIRQVLGGRSPHTLFLTHSHFDHIGAAAYLKGIYPSMKIAGSKRTQEILQRENAVQLIRSLNEEARRSLEALHVTPLFSGPFEPFDLDFSLEGGEIIDLGGCHVEVLNTPGHTWDFMSYFIPERRLLVASEAVGCDEGSGYIYTEFLVDYDAYVDSLTALSRLGAEILCQGHRVVFTGPDARGHMDRSLRQAPRFLAMVKGFLEEEKGDVERTVARVKAVEWDPRPWPKQTESAYIINTRARVSAIRRQMEASRRGKG